MRGVIFDLDGVIVDSMPDHYKAWKMAFKEVTDIEVDERTIYLLEGMRGIDLVKKIFEQKNYANYSIAKKVIERKNKIGFPSHIVVRIGCAAYTEFNPLRFKIGIVSSFNYLSAYPGCSDEADEVKAFPVVRINR